MSARDLIAEAVALAGGTITGRVRLQKIMYLLSRKGLGGNFSFAYHHYGPFSRSVDEAISEAKAFRGLREEVGHRAVDGAPFSVFRLDAPELRRPGASLGMLPVAHAEAAIKTMISVPSTVIEIAATIHWLRHEEKIVDWESELLLRKGPKAGSGRVEQALALLDKLQLN